MNRFDEPNANSDSSTPSREALETRIRELEAENAELRTKMQKMESEWEDDRYALEWYRSEGLPKSEAEMLERKGPTISEILAECEREFGK
ncbi:MAG TPA: hypothetical protein VKD71_06080 [Gemmataceae bacterium]|nr:hypothetical protein [Gemmataceae bacterium]